MEKEKNSLKVNFLNLELINPFVLASAPPTKDYESIKKGFEAGWAGAVTKSVVLQPLKDKTPRIGHIKQKGRIIASQNYEMGSDKNIEYWIKNVNRLREEFDDRMLYVSIFAGPDLGEWRELASIFRETKAQGLELNFSCPHSEHNGKGAVIGQNPDLCASITAEVKKNISDKLKIMPKMTYLAHPNEGLVAESCIKAGADAICGINTIAGLSEIDPYSLTPKLNAGGKTAAGGISYDLIRPFGRLIVSNIAKAIGKHPVSACGGVSKNLESMVEYLALGANHLQVCTEVMNNGYGVINKMKKVLINYLEETGRTLDGIRGVALEKIVGWDQLDNIKRVAEISNECKNCYSCLDVCGYEALKKSNSKVKVDTSLCSGCGSCYATCENDSIKMIEK